MRVSTFIFISCAFTLAAFLVGCFVIFWFFNLSLFFIYKRQKRYRSEWKGSWEGTGMSRGRVNDTQNILYENKSICLKICMKNKLPEHKNICSIMLTLSLCAILKNME